MWQGRALPDSRVGGLDRIVVRWNRAAVPSDYVNPIYFKRVEQIHRVGGSPPAIQSDPDLLYRGQQPPKSKAPPPPRPGFFVLEMARAIKSPLPPAPCPASPHPP